MDKKTKVEKCSPRKEKKNSDKSRIYVVVAQISEVRDAEVKSRDRKGEMGKVATGR